MSILATMTSDTTLDTAFAWLCKRRQNYPASADVWDFRRNWRQEKARIRSDLLSGDYRFGLLSRVKLADGEEVDLRVAHLINSSMCDKLSPTMERVSRSEVQYICR